MDTIDRARAVMESADDAYFRAADAGASIGTLDVLAQAAGDAEAAYYRACDMWEPAS